MLSSTDSDNIGGIIMVSLEDEGGLTYLCGFVCHRKRQQKDDVAAVLVRLGITRDQWDPEDRLEGWQERCWRIKRLALRMSVSSY